MTRLSYNSVNNESLHFVSLNRYCFDDTKVEAVNDTNLITNSAYILFYQRRGLTGNSSGNSSAASTSSAGSGVDHWVSRMPPFFLDKDNATGNDNETKTQKPMCQEKIVEEKNLNNFNRGSRNYSTLQPFKQSVATETEFEAEHYSDDEAVSRREWVCLSVF